MNRKLLALFSLILLVGCRGKSPFDRTHNDSGGALNAFGSGNFVIFGEELQTGGGAFFYPGGENQSISFSDESNPVERRSIHYVWTGDPTGGQNVFAGFDLMHTPTQAAYSTTVGKDLRAAGYRQLTFYVRGTLASHNVLKIEAADDGDQLTTIPCLVLSTNGTDTGSTGCTNIGKLTSSSQLFRLAIPASSLANVKDFFKATIIFDNPIVGSTVSGQGGSVFFDQIEYTP